MSGQCGPIRRPPPPAGADVAVTGRRAVSVVTGSVWWDALFGLAVGVALLWLVLIVATVVLRSVVRRAGLVAVRRHWPGSDHGFDAVCRLVGLQRLEIPSRYRR